jgi:hypothetical protein
MRRELLANAVRRYAVDTDAGCIAATFRILFLTAWSPPQPRVQQ